MQIENKKQKNISNDDNQSNSHSDIDRFYILSIFSNIHCFITKKKY